jgi:hypothetical protein
MEAKKMNIGELKKPRDYSQEHKKRAEKKSRLVVDMDKKLANEFMIHLGEKGLTFSQWIQTHIKNELKSQK